MGAMYYDLRAPAYTYNLSTLKQFGTVGFKLVQMACVRTRGVELECPPPKGSVNCEKLSNNIVRARSKVREYGLCNNWDYFVTLTLDASKRDRYDLPAFWKAFSQFIRDYRKRYGISVHYLFIPEQHKDGAWHAHGFLYGLSAEHLRPFTLQEKLPAYLRAYLRQNGVLYDWPQYRDRFGFITLEPIRDKQRAVSYITKYITKDLEYSVDRLGAHLYYASRGLHKAEEIKRGQLVQDVSIDYANEHCSITWFDAATSTAEQLKALIQSPHDIMEE